MAGIKDFKCTYDNSAGINEKVTQGLSLTFPDAYMHAETMAVLAKALKRHDGSVLCMLPFCHTVEAEALGGMIRYGDGRTAPRVRGYRFHAPEELLTLPEIDFTKGRIHEVLLACRMIQEQGETAVLQISGPFTVLGSLIDIKNVFKAMRKKPELMKRVFGRLETELLRFIAEAKKYGAEFISYADAAGGVNILGPGMTAMVTEKFTYGFLKKAQELTDSHTLILLCPKTAFALLGTEKAVFRDIELPEVMSYAEACIYMTGKAAFAGQMCIKNTGFRLENRIFREIILK